jgi:hypothetical protein
MIQPPHKHLSLRKIMKYTAVVLVLLFGAGVDIRAQDDPEKYFVVGVDDGDTLNVRSRPDENSSIVTKLRNGYNGITISGEVVWNGNDDWVPIFFSNAKGWVRPKYLAESNERVVWNANVPVRRATIATPDEDASDQSPAKTDTVPSVSNGNDRVLLGIFALVAGAIVINELFDGDTISLDQSQADDAAERANIQYTREKFERIENDLATSRGDPPPYPNTPH